MGLLGRFVSTMLMNPEQAQKERHHQDKMMMEAYAIQAKVETAHIAGQYAHEIEVQRGIAHDRNTRIKIHEENIATQEQMILQSNLEMKKMLLEYELKSRQERQAHSQNMELETHKHQLKTAENNTVTKEELEAYMSKYHGYRPDY